MHYAILNQRAACVGVGASQHHDAGAMLFDRAAARDGAVEIQVVRPIKDQTTVVDHITNNGPRCSSIA
ncbi:hypothetical protein [Brevundimonas diminuta]|uniref:hypothetical protein n=1 Tax=Brevundimonas diminuta TaxID=293 RepID=UPI00320B2D0A